MKRKKLILKLALGLLAVLLVFTFLSRTVNNLLLPEVTTALVEQTTVPRTTYATGVLGIEGQQEVRAGKNWVVDEVLVEPGDKVREGDPLFTLELEDYTDQLEAAQDSLDLLLEELSGLTESMDGLTVTAPFAGKLVDVNENITKGAMVPAGTTVATIVNADTLLLRQYFSYAYRGKITGGMTASVSLPGMMTSTTGTVRQVNMVNKVTAEGAKLFEVVVAVKNTGALTQGVAASASIRLSGGAVATPYEAGALEYSDRQAIVTETGGTCLVNNLLEDLEVGAGAALLRLDSDSFDDQIKAKEKQVERAREALEKLKEKVPEGNTVTAPISGQLSGFDLVPGYMPQRNELLLTVFPESGTLKVDFTLPAEEGSIYSRDASALLTFESLVQDVYSKGMVVEQQTAAAELTEGKVSGVNGDWAFEASVESYKGKALLGRTVQLTITAVGPTQMAVVPASAVSQGADGSYQIFSVMEQDGLFGKEHVVTALPVKVLYSNNLTTAVEGTGVYMNLEVVRNTTKYLSSGDVVRVRLG